MEKNPKNIIIFVGHSIPIGKTGSRPACWDSGRPTKQAQFQMPYLFPSTSERG